MLCSFQEQKFERPRGRKKGGRVPMKSPGLVRGKTGEDRSIWGDRKEVTLRSKNSEKEKREKVIKNRGKKTKVSREEGGEGERARKTDHCAFICNAETVQRARRLGEGK